MIEEMRSSDISMTNGKRRTIKWPICEYLHSGLHHITLHYTTEQSSTALCWEVQCSVAHSIASREHTNVHTNIMLT